MVILSGLTGSGKTHVLNKTRYQIDLEGLANHRGSAFGSDINDFQPTQINWENQLSIDCLKYRLILLLIYWPAASKVIVTDNGNTLL
jgi:tRNA 2-selenouridine synthase